MDFGRDRLIDWRCRRWAKVLVDVAEGAATEPERQKLETHVRNCERCAASLRALHEVPTVLRALPMPERTPDEWRRQRQSILRRVRNAEPARPWFFRPSVPLLASAVAAVAVAVVTVRPLLRPDTAGPPELRPETMARLAEVADLLVPDGDVAGFLTEVALMDEPATDEESKGAAVPSPWWDPETEWSDDELERAGELIGAFAGLA